MIDAATAEPAAVLTAWRYEAARISAAAVVVTLYGDVVAPRGGELWTGNIIETLAMAGITETRVRTALSRLVAAGQLEGAKVGRRSYYRLTPAAEREFALAARLIYAPVEPPPQRGWHLVLLPDGERETHAPALARARFGFALPQLAVLPDRGEPLPPLPGTHFRATTADDFALARAWQLDALAERTRRFIDFFAGLEARAATPDQALGLRLALTHAFREIALRDPHLPPGLLPADWPGSAARRLFVELYLALSPATEEIISTRFKDRVGPLRPNRERLDRRIRDLKGEPLTE
ncbi:PaaX family transcriptional regulator C-terminal domain-containing protein [Amaricoccus solimangrovi]|nr:PaaX family transcriptional regulator C-terminal domain-containing protein [Amaricoccus solimangrovi]